MGSDTFLCVPRVGNPGFPSDPIPEISKISRGASNQPWHCSNSSQPHSRQDRYFSTFLTYLVKIADELIRIMSNLGASKHSAATVKCWKAELWCKTWHPLLIPASLLMPVPAPPPNNPCSSCSSLHPCYILHLLPAQASSANP